jgi:hypothetical protein
MPRLLQVNTMGAWKNVLALRLHQVRAMEDAKTAVVLLASATDESASFRIVDRLSGMEDRVVWSWDRGHGWRRGQ